MGWVRTSLGLAFGRLTEGGRHTHLEMRVDPLFAR